MKKEKKYICCYDNGDNYNNEFEFYSFYRANSKGNLEDALKENTFKYGKNHSIKITNIYLR